MCLTSWLNESHDIPFTMEPFSLCLSSYMYRMQCVGVYIIVLNLRIKGLSNMFMAKKGLQVDNYVKQF